MFMSILAGGMSLAIASGLVDVLIVRADAIKKQGSVSAGVDLAIGVVLLLLGLLVAAGWPRRQRKSGPKRQQKNGWAQKLREPTQVGAVLVFVIIEFLLIVIPWACLELWPERTAAALRGSQAWIGSHARKLLAWTALVLGTYLVIRALVRLL
jgi:Sap, sulfolipid-1-addressing protein